MKKTLYTGFFSALLVVCTAAVLSAAGHKLIDGNELNAMMSDGKPIVIVDVRETYEFSDGHIKGAINIPYDAAKSRILKDLSVSDRVVFVCHGGPMGDDLGSILIKNGYKEVYNLRGGMKKWKGEVVK